MEVQGSREARIKKAQKSTGFTTDRLFGEVIHSMQWDDREKETVKVTISLQALGYLMFMLLEYKDGD